VSATSIRIFVLVPARPDREVTPAGRLVGHRVETVDGQVEDDLLELDAIAVDEGKSRGQVRAQ